MGSCTAGRESASVADTIGAGDSYMSGLVAALAQLIGIERVVAGRADLDELVEVGRVASLAADITVSRAGAAPPTTAELEKTPMVNHRHAHAL